VVLTSRLSASASEIVAGALKDYKRAIIVGGDHTFGKGSVQSVVRLPNNLGAIKVTVGMFYIPGGQSTQHQGVDADVPLPGAFNRDEVGEKSLDYSLPPRKITPFLSESAAGTAEGRWTPVTKELITELRKASEKRVSLNEEFKKVQTELEKSLAKGKTVSVAEVLEKQEETKENEKKRKARAKDAKLRVEEYLKRADLQEAVNVLSDLVVAQQKNSVIATGATATPDKKN
jgi:carboxyl-terminal processing protease